MDDQPTKSGHDAESVGVSETTPENKGAIKKLAKKKLSFRNESDDSDGANRRVTRSKKMAQNETKAKVRSVEVSSESSDSSSSEEEEEPQPTKEQRHARRGISQKLPVFSGRPEDWPMFYGAFNASNKSCGYTNNENVVRLQECRKGPALELVRGKLIRPELVPRAIEKLQCQLAERLGAGGVPERLAMRWTAGIKRVEKDSRKLNLSISAVDSSEVQQLKDVHTVEKLD
uniref:Uncharacterized protein n=1 Tax=Anopheles minimus TaxID=112268 RepID=A0A182VT23_9DIPT